MIMDNFNLLCLKILFSLTKRSSSELVSLIVLCLDFEWLEWMELNLVDLVCSFRINDTFLDWISFVIFSSLDIIECSPMLSIVYMGDHIKVP